MQAKLDMEGSATASLQLLAEAPDFIGERGWKKNYPTIPTIWAPRETIYVYLQVITRLSFLFHLPSSLGHRVYTGGGVWRWMRGQ